MKIGIINSTISANIPVAARKISKKQNTITPKIHQELTPHKPNTFFGSLKVFFNKTIAFITNKSEQQSEVIKFQPQKPIKVNVNENLNTIQPIIIVKPEKTKVQELQDALLAAARTHIEPELKPYKNPFAIPPVREQLNTPKSSLDLQNALLYAAKNFDFTDTPKPSIIDFKIQEIGARLKKINDQQTLVKSVVDFVSKKLGAKTFEQQKADFAQNATKMRLQMLPEIFSSISETRKLDRSAGLKKSRSSNQDALLLFQKINTNNKRLVNYLLKIRKNDGSRVYEVKDIISILQNAENTIQQKKNSPEKFMSRDVKEFYRGILKTNIEQYGKVKRKQKNL